MRKDSTGLRVEIAFGFLVALLIGVGWLGLSRMGDINASTNRLFDERWDKLYVSRLASSYFNSNYRIITRYFLLQDGDLGASAALTEQIKENTSNASARWKQILAGPVSPVEKDMLLKILAAKAPADKSLQEAWSLLADGRKSGEANKLMVSETLPLLNRYRDTWVAFMDYEQDQMNQAKSQIKTSYADVWRISSILVSLAIALAVCIAFFVARKFSAEMQERERAQDSIRHLNESLEKKVAERTEELARTVDTLREEVNERRVQEANLRRLAAIVESTDDAIIGATLDGVITDWNAGAERMFGFSRSEIIGKPILTIVPPELSYEPPESREKILKGESVVRYESVRIRKDGKPLHIAIAVSPLKDQSGRVVGRCAVLRDNTERKFIEDAHRRSEASFRSFVENAPYGILRKTLEGRIVQANPALVEMLGYASEKEVLGLNMGRDVYCRPGDREAAMEWCRDRDSVRGVEVEWKDKTGKVLTIRYAAHVVKDSEGKIEFLESFVEDISERKAMEQQLRQGQKMEAIGRLAGGIAHDFNNLLGVIIGYGDLLAEQVGAGGALYNPVVQIKKAADRASALTRQLLAFSRQQVLERKALNLNAVVAEMGLMLQRLLGEDIDLDTSLDPALGQVKADQGQIEQVLMNLAVNARDAMPGGGRLFIETRNVSFDETSAQAMPPMLPGEYVMILVKDTGMGMDAQTQAHIFEPFFTTKERGKGTGLGLATVYGFVKQSGGYVWVKSERGAGSTFTIYLPQVREQAAPIRAGAAPAATTARGVGTILLVEDEESLRTLTRNFLEQTGYTVLEACSGDQALEIAREYSGPIHLLLTDMVMPGMNGRAVAERVGRLYPEIRVAYMSGYTGFSTQEAASFDAIIIPKPFTRNLLLQKLIEVFELEPKPTRA